MSTGAVFQLLANEGKADSLILASKLLSQRLADVRCARRARGLDETPTLPDIEASHILYVNASFKPFAAVGYEYNKVSPGTGTPTLGGSVTFNIPQFGDFFHDMVARVRLSAATGVAGLAPTPNTPLMPRNGYEADNTSTNASKFYNIVDTVGNVIVAGEDASSSVPAVSYSNYVRYCEYPGNRLFSSVKFDVSGNPLDQYDEMVPVMLEKFCTSPGKRVGYNRLVGQEVPIEGYSGLRNSTVTDADAVHTPVGLIDRSKAGQSNSTVGLFNTSAVGLSAASTITQTATTALNSVGSAQIDISRTITSVVNGPQTPKPTQPPLELWHKLRFWFNDDVRLSIPSVSIPYGQRYISMDISAQDLLIHEFPSIYLETIFDDGTSRSKTYSPIFQKFGVQPVSVEQIQLYINNLFVTPEVHDIFINRIGFSLVRVYRQQRSHVSSTTDGLLLSQFKWPVEMFMCGLRPTWNVKPLSGGNNGAPITGNENQWRDWHQFTRMVDATSDAAVAVEITAGTAGALAPGGVQSTGQIMPDRYYLSVPTVDSLSLTSHGVPLYDNFQDKFYNQYLPLQYGGANVNTPSDLGALMVNLCLFPRSYQPSGHLNFSRARETYVKWTSSYVSQTSGVDFIAVAIAINFLLISDGAAVIRYST